MNGFGDGLARAFELAVTPLIFGAIGYGLDRWIGIVPVLTLVFSLVALVIKGYVMIVEYDQAMRRLDDTAPWARGRAGRTTEQPHG